MLVHKALEGVFNYNVTPLAPPVTQSLIYKVPYQRAVQAPHANDGWFLGLEMHHYQCSRYWIPMMGAMLITATIKYFPMHCKMPTISDADKTIVAAAELAKALNIQLGL